MKKRYVAAEKKITYVPTEGRVIKETVGWIIYDKQKGKRHGKIGYRTKSVANKKCKLLNEYWS